MKCFGSVVSKYAIFVINLVIASGAAVLIAYGIKYTEDENDGVPIFGDFLMGALAITAGAIALVVAIFGCVSACLQKTRFLRIYAGILMGLFVVQLSLGIMAITKIQNRDLFIYNLKNLMQRLDISNFYSFQQEWKCCGINGLSDYNFGYPPSCCENGADPCVRPFENGCATAYSDVLGEYIEIIGYVAIVFAVLELLGGFFAFTMREKMQRSSSETNLYEDYYY